MEIHIHLCIPARLVFTMTLMCIAEPKFAGFDDRKPSRVFQEKASEENLASPSRRTLTGSHVRISPYIYIYIHIYNMYIYVYIYTHTHICTGVYFAWASPITGRGTPSAVFDLLSSLCREEPIAGKQEKQKQARKTHLVVLSEYIVYLNTRI